MEEEKTIRETSFPKILVVLREMSDGEILNISKLSVKCKVTYSYLSRLKTTMLEKKLVEITKIDNRSTGLVITDKGRRIVDAFNIILQEMDIEEVIEKKYSGSLRGD
jgi:predicted transcriptional regulator